MREYGKSANKLYICIHLRKVGSIIHYSSFADFRRILYSPKLAEKEIKILAKNEGKKGLTFNLKIK
jgi:hypothetical protein